MLYTFSLLNELNLVRALADHNQDPSGCVRQIIAKAVSDSRLEGLINLTVPSLVIRGGYNPVFSIAHSIL